MRNYLDKLFTFAVLVLAASTCVLMVATQMQLKALRIESQINREAILEADRDQLKVNEQMLNILKQPKTPLKSNPRRR